MPLNGGMEEVQQHGSEGMRMVVGRKNVTPPHPLYSRLFVGLAAAITFAIAVPWPDGAQPVPPKLQMRATAPRAFSPNVRVKLTTTPLAKIELGIDSPCDVRLLGSSRVIGTLEPRKSVQARALVGGIRVGDREFPATRIEIVPRTSPALWLGEHRYRGSIRLLKQPSGRLVAVNVLPMEDYLASVVNGETPATFHQAARRAQAIVARTYALYQLQQRPAGADFDVYATTRSQKYLGHQYRDRSGRLLAGESRASRKLVADTQGMVCTYRGRIFCTYYSAVCGDRTTDGRAVFSDAAPPLRSVVCGGCRHATYYRWKVRIPSATVSKRLAPLLRKTSRSFGDIQEISRVSTKDAAVASQYVLTDGRRRATIAGPDLRRALSTGAQPIYSSNFQANRDGPSWVFEGKGHGHGVGLCQWGADGLASSGQSCLEIVRRYYPGCKVVRLR